MPLFFLLANPNPLMSSVLLMSPLLLTAHIAARATRDFALDQNKSDYQLYYMSENCTMRTLNFQFCEYLNNESSASRP